ncbi:MAG: hypothetical protein GYA14_08505 [Ignavibacteria bacterium]|nr:hypothetical protein [Ignavibacteria bacterium]
MNSKSIFLLLLFFNSLLCMAQSEKKYDPQSYKTEFDSLFTLKNKNDNSKQELLNEINKLKKQSTELSEKIVAINLEIEKLYTDKFGKEYGLRIFNKQIWKGMTEQMLSASWGKPDKIDKNVEKWGTFTQWYYGKITFFFRDGKLTDWEELK